MLHGKNNDSEQIGMQITVITNSHILYLDQSAITKCITTLSHYQIILNPSLSVVALWWPFGTGTRELHHCYCYFTIGTLVKHTLMDIKSITENDHIVQVMVTLMKCVSFGS